jgi:hypothetical protein
VVFDAADVGGVSDAVHVSTGGARTCATRMVSPPIGIGVWATLWRLSLAALGIAQF